MPYDWNNVRYELDDSGKYHEIYNSAWSSDRVYGNFSETKFKRRHRTLMPTKCSRKAMSRA